MKTVTLTVDGSVLPLKLQTPTQISAGALMALIREVKPETQGSLYLFKEDEADCLDEAHLLDFDDLTDFLHLARRKLVNITVHYQSASFCLRTAPATRIRRIRREAIDYFKVDSGEAARLVLIQTGTTEPLDLMARIGSITEACDIDLDLVPHSKIQG